MEDVLAAKIVRLLHRLGQLEPTEHPTPTELDEAVTMAALRLGCIDPLREPGLSGRKVRGKFLLRRVLFMGAAGARRTLTEPPSTVAETIARTENDGLRSIIVFGGSAEAAYEICKASGQQVVYVPNEDSELEPEAAASFERVPGMMVTDPMSPGQLPFYLRGRFQTAVLHPPVEGVGAHKAFLAALSALEPGPGRRLYWTGHPARQQNYFGLYSMLAGRGWLLQRLVHDMHELPLESGWLETLREELHASADDPLIPDASAVEDLMSITHEYEHFHLFRPIDEIVVRAEQLDMIPLQPKDVPVFETWLTPELADEMVMPDGRDHTSPETRQRPLLAKNWYPEWEWWMLRTKDGRGVGFIRMVLKEYWARRLLTWDIALVDKSVRGRGLLDDMFRLAFHRHFDQLRGEKAWALVGLKNIPLLKGARKNHYTGGSFQTFESGLEYEHFHILAQRYWQLRASGEILPPEEG